MTSVYDPLEQFAGNPSINTDLHEILERTSEPSRSRMLKKLREHMRALEKYGSENVDEGARHMFRELLVGDKLNRAGYRLEFSPNIEGKTPDWYDEGSHLIIEVFTCERGGVSELEKRVAQSIEEKVTKYQKIIGTHSVSFVVAVHGDFVACLDFEDCEYLIADHHLFDRFPALSGVIYFSENGCKSVTGADGSTRRKQLYSYRFIANPSAERAIDLSESLQGP